jgi:hypothetical protein
LLQVLVDQRPVDEVFEQGGARLGLAGRRHALQPQALLHGAFGDDLAVDLGNGGICRQRRRRRRGGGQAARVGLGRGRGDGQPERQQRVQVVPCTHDGLLVP